MKLKTGLPLTLWAVVGRDKTGAEWLAGVRQHKNDAHDLRCQTRRVLPLYKYVLRPVRAELNMTQVKK